MIVTKTPKKNKKEKKERKENNEESYKDENSMNIDMKSLNINKLFIEKIESALLTKFWVKWKLDSQSPSRTLTLYLALLYCIK